MKLPPYISALTENDMIPAPKETKIMGSRVNSSEKLFYPASRKKAKDDKPMNLEDELIGALMPIVYALNKGKGIQPKSPEHKLLKELLTKINK